MSRKIKNEKHIAILGVPYTAITMSGAHTYKKGHKANTVGLYERGGEYIVEGHGLGHTIPKENFTKFVHSWDEVFTTKENGAKVVKTVHHEVDDTVGTLEWWGELDAKKQKAKNVERRKVIRYLVADLRKSIAEVESGQAGENLKRLLSELDSLKGK